MWFESFSTLDDWYANSSTQLRLSSFLIFLELVLNVRYSIPYGGSVTIKSTLPSGISFINSKQSPCNNSMLILMLLLIVSLIHHLLLKRPVIKPVVSLRFSTLFQQVSFPKVSLPPQPLVVYHRING